MFEATKKLIEHCKHLPQMSRIFSNPLVELAEKEIAEIESQLTPRALDASPTSESESESNNGSRQ